MRSEFEAFKYVDTLPKQDKALRFVWKAIWLFVFRFTPGWTLHEWRCTLLRLFGARIGVGSRISPSCFVWAPWRLRMGEFSVLADGVNCYNVAEIVIGSKVAVSQRAFLCTATHDIRSLYRPLVAKPISIQNHVWIAAEAMVLPGITINEGAVVAARAVVTHDVASWAVVAGNPAKFVRRRVLNDREPAE